MYVYMYLIACYSSLHPTLSFPLHPTPYFPLHPALYFPLATSFLHLQADPL